MRAQQRRQTQFYFPRLARVQLFERFATHYLLQAFLKYLVSQLRAKPEPPLILMIDSRLKAVTSPEEISKALCDAVVCESLLQRAESTAGAFAELLLSSTAVLGTLGAEVGVQLENLKDYFAKDEDNLAETLEKLDGLFEKLKELPNQPVIIIGKARASWSLVHENEFSALF